jgi:hypothetical protein
MFGPTRQWTARFSDYSKSTPGCSTGSWYRSSLLASLIVVLGILRMLGDDGDATG